MLKSKLFVLFVFTTYCAFAQKDSTLDKNTIDSLINWLKNKEQTSYFDANINFSNGSFSNNVITATQNNNINKLIIMPNVGYYHKSGLGINLGVNFTTDQGKTTAFQTFFSPSYDYFGEKVNAGLSFAKYFNKDSFSYYISPLTNEISSYIKFKKGFINPRLSATYSWGSQNDIISDSALIRKLRRRYPRVPLSQLLKTETKANDFTIVASIEHEFEKEINDKEALTFTPTLYLTAGTSRYGSNLKAGAAGPGPIGQQLANNISNNENYAFNLQTINFDFSAMYMKGSFYVQPQIVFTYLTPKSISQWYFTANLTAGVSF